MAIDLQIVLGTVNYSDFLRVSAAKVSDPSTEVYSTYINTPVTNYVLVIPDLDPDNYYIRFRDAPDTSSLGTLVSEAFVNARTGEFIWTKKYYRIGSLEGPVSNTINTLTDTDLINANVTEVFKEGFRFLDPDSEWTFDDSTGEISMPDYTLSDGEVLIVTIQHSVPGSVSSTASSIFSATIQVTAATYTIDALDKGKRFCLDCSGSKQEITLPPLSSLSAGDIIYMEHKRNGVQAQSRIKTAGSDVILFNGLDTGDNELTEMWVSKGHSLYLRKEGTNWEVIFDWAGVRVGERMSGTFKDHPNWKPEDGTLYDGDEFPGIYWWIANVLPSTHKIIDDTVVSGGYAHPAGKEGLFVIHSTLKSFRLPNTQARYEKGLLDFDTYGSDTDRTYDYPGGTMADRNKEHGHGIATTNGSPSGNNTADPVRGTLAGTVASTQGIEWTSGADTKTIRKSGGATVEVKNFGVIYLRCMG